MYSVLVLVLTIWYSGQCLILAPRHRAKVPGLSSWSDYPKWGFTLYILYTKLDNDSHFTAHVLNTIGYPYTERQNVFLPFPRHLLSFSSPCRLYRNCRKQKSAQFMDKVPGLTEVLPGLNSFFHYIKFHTNPMCPYKAAARIIHARFKRCLLYRQMNKRMGMICSYCMPLMLMQFPRDWVMRGIPAKTFSNVITDNWMKMKRWRLDSTFQLWYKS